MTGAGCDATATACGGKAVVAGGPLEPASDVLAAILAPFHVTAPSGSVAPLLLAALGVLVALACFAFRRIGVSPLESLVLLVAAPLLAHVEADVWQATPAATVAVNAAGFLLPALVAVRMIATGRAPFLLATFALAFGTFAAFLSSYAVPNEGVLLYYRLPALGAGALAVLLARGARERIGPLAYVAGAGGVIIGADALRLSQLLVGTEPHRIVIGGAGVLDGIFLVGLLALVVALFGDALVSNAKSAVNAARGEPTDEPRAASRDVGGLS